MKEPNETLVQVLAMLVSIGVFWCVWTWSGYGVHWFPELRDCFVCPSYVDILAAVFCVRFISYVIRKGPK